MSQATLARPGEGPQRSRFRVPLLPPAGPGREAAAPRNGGGSFPPPTRPRAGGRAVRPGPAPPVSPTRILPVSPACPVSSAPLREPGPARPGSNGAGGAAAAPQAPGPPDMAVAAPQRGRAGPGRAEGGA